MQTTIAIVDTLLFVFASLAVLYLLVFAVAAALRGKERVFPRAGEMHRIAVLIPAYKEDRVIEAAVRSALAQDYPRDRYDVVVLSDRMQAETDRRLEALGARVLRLDFEESSKAKALNFAVGSLEGTPYQIAVILDADNTVREDFLGAVNDAYDAGVTAIQAHRQARNRDTDTAVLDAVSEEINNAIFRKGHVALGFSSALIGSGMALDYSWLRDHLPQVSTAGEDKELEALLLRQGVYIGYLDKVPVYDEKTRGQGAFYRQRRRWLAAQFGAFGRAARDFPGALLRGNFDYCDKMLQWMMPPRVLLLAFTGLCAVVLLFINWGLSIKWWALLLVLLFALALSIPDYLVDAKFKRAIRKIPLLALMMAVNLFRTRGVNKKFIHTEHTGNTHGKS